MVWERVRNSRNLKRARRKAGGDREREDKGGSDNGNCKGEGSGRWRRSGSAAAKIPLGLWSHFRRVADSRPLVPLKQHIASSIAPDIYASGMAVTPQDYAAQLISLSAAAATASASALLAALLLGMPLLYPLAAAPVMPILAHALRPFLNKSRRKSACERELPYAVTYLTMAAASSISLTSAIMNLTRLRPLSAFSAEAERIDKVRRLYGMSPAEAIIFEAKRHPSEQVRSALLAAVAAQQSGESLFAVMKDEMMKSFSHLLSRLKTMSDKFSLIASSQIIIYIILPMSILTMGIMFSGVLGVPMVLATCLVMPCLFAPVFALMVDSYYPKELTEPVDLRPFAASLAFAPAGAALFLAQQSLPALRGLPFYYAFALLIAAVGIPSGLIYTKARSETRSILNALPPFSRSVSEEVKKGMSPTQAIVRLSGARSFNRHFDTILKKVSAHVSAGRRIAESSDSVRMPWIARVYFHMLDHAEGMGADPKSMDALSDLINNMHSSVRSLDSETSLFKLSCIINSVILPFSITLVMEVVVSLFADISRMLPTSLPMAISFISPESVPFLSTIAYTGVILNAYFMGLLGGKVSRGGSVADGVVLAVTCAAIAAATVYVLKDLRLITGIFSNANV